MSYPPQGSTTEMDGNQVRQELADTRKKLQDYADTIVSLYGELRTLRENICSTCKRKFVPSQAAPPVGNASSFVDQVSPSQVAKRTNSTSPGHPLLEAQTPDDFPSSSDLTTPKIRRSTRRIPQTLNAPLPIVATPTHIRISSPLPVPTAAHASGDFPTSSNLPTPKIRRSTRRIPQTLNAPLPIVATPTHIRIPSPLPVPTTVNGDEKPSSVSYPLPSSNAAIPKIAPSVPRWFVTQGTVAILDVAFVCAFDHNNWVRSVRFSADGKYLAAALGGIEGRNGGIVIYDVETYKKICVLVENVSQYRLQARPTINSVSFSPDGRYLVAGDMAGRVTVWDITNKRIRNVFRDRIFSVQSVDFSPNGRLVASASWNSGVCVWNMRDGSANVFGSRFLSVKFSPNGQYVAAGGYGKNLRIWNVRTGRLVKELPTPTGCRSVVFTPDGRNLLSGNDDSVKCWNVSSLGMCQPGIGVLPKILRYGDYKTALSSAAVSPDGRWVSSSFGEKVALWDTRRSLRQYILIGHGDVVSSVDFSPVGSYLALGSRDCHVTLWRYTRI